MSEIKWKSPLANWQEKNQDPNLMFTLVARNERARQMWADPHNRSRYIPASFARGEVSDGHGRSPTSTAEDPRTVHEQPSLEEKDDTEPKLQFRFNGWHKNFAKGFVLGSCNEACDALLGDPAGDICSQMLVFTINRNHELIMNVTSDKETFVTFYRQREAKRTRFSWIFPLGQRAIRVKVAKVLEFDVVLPEYGINKKAFHKNCESWLSAASCGDQLAGNLDINSTVATGQASGTSTPCEPFYLRGKRLGRGAYGAVYKVLRMPDGETFAAKRFRDLDYFREEADMLKMVSKTFHKNIVTYVDEWHGDYKPLLIMEYVAGGSLVSRIEEEFMDFDEIADLANQILDALVFLQDQGVIHRDIKPANILCEKSNRYKLADFGVSREIGPFMSRQGTAGFIAPEIHDLASYSYTADIWSLAVVLFSCMDALPDPDPDTVGRKWCEVVYSEFRLYYQDCLKHAHRKGIDIHKLLLLIKNAMLRMDPDDRMSARECLEDYQDLWQSLDCGKASGAASGTNTPIRSHSDGSFSPDSLSTSDGEETVKETSLTVRSTGGDPSEEGREPQHFRNEDRTTVIRHTKAEPLRGRASLSHKSIDAETTQDQDLIHPTSNDEETIHDQGVT